MLTSSGISSELFPGISPPVVSVSVLAVSVVVAAACFRIVVSLFLSTPPSKYMVTSSSYCSFPDNTTSTLSDHHVTSQLSSSNLAPSLAISNSALATLLFAISSISLPGAPPNGQYGSPTEYIDNMYCLSGELVLSTSFSLYLVVYLKQTNGINTISANTPSVIATIFIVFSIYLYFSSISS